MPTIKEQCEQRIADLLKWPDSADGVYILPEPDLQDILLAIEKTRGKGIKTKKTIIVSSYGMFMDSSFNHQVYYDLSKPFSDQSPDFYSFLLEIIK